MSQDLIRDWDNARANLEAAKNEEMKLRLAVAKELFNYDEMTEREGTDNLELGSGWKLKATFKMNRNLSTKKGEVEKALNLIALEGEEALFMAKRLVSWKPSLALKEYKELPANLRKIFDEVLTIKPATPSLEIVPPKGK